MPKDVSLKFPFILWLIQVIANIVILLLIVFLLLRQNAAFSDAIRDEIIERGKLQESVVKEFNLRNRLLIKETRKELRAGQKRIICILLILPENRTIEDVRRCNLKAHSRNPSTTSPGTSDSDSDDGNGDGPRPKPSPTRPSPSPSPPKPSPSPTIICIPVADECL